jgi:AcrR family transcriptional regulator
MEATMGDVSESIRQEARALWAAKGFDNVAIADICEAANVSTSTFFYHYKSVTALGLAVFGEIIPVTDLVTILVTSQGTTWEMIDEMIDHTRDTLEGHDQLLIALMKEQLGSRVMWDDPVGLMYVFNFIVQRGQVRGEIDESIDPEVASDLMAAVFAGLCTRAAAEGSTPSELAEHIRDSAHFLARRYATPEFARP